MCNDPLAEKRPDDASLASPVIRPQWLLRHRWLLIWLSVGVYLVVGLADLLVKSCSQWRCSDFPQGLVELVLFHILTPLALVWFIEIFSAPLPPNTNSDAGVDGGSPQPSAYFLALKRRWMVFAYGFMFFAIGIAIYPFMVDRVPEQGEAARLYLDRIMDAPISVLRGCVNTESGSTGALACSPLTAANGQAVPDRRSWMIQIGGQVEARCPGSTYPTHAAAQTPGQAPGSGKDAPPTPQPTQPRGTLPTQEPDAKGAADVLKTCPDTMILTVSGGLAVPLYLVILSLIGGAISLTRRIPEYQKQSDPSWVPTANAPRLTPAMLREYLVFQIIQFVSAPLIAGVAYYLIEPDTTAATVGLAFASGFASETILLWVRAMVEKLAPVGAPGVRPGSVVGRVTEADRAPAAEATVTVVGMPTLTAATDKDGWFVLDGIPPGDWAVELLAKESQVRHLIRVQVKPDKASQLPVQLPMSSA